MILESKQHPFASRYLSLLQQAAARPYVKSIVISIVMILFVLSSKYIGLQIILQSCMIGLGLVAIICRISSQKILQLAFATIILVPISNLIGISNLANVLTIYTFIILCTGVLCAIVEEIRAPGGPETKKVRKGVKYLTKTDQNGLNRSR